MRPSILVVIFDFLIGSLLLFVVAPDAGYQAVLGRSSGNAAPAEEFSAAAIAAHFDSSSAEWDREWADIKRRDEKESYQQLVSELDKTKQTLVEMRQDLATSQDDLKKTKEAEAEGARKVAALIDQLDAKQMENKSLTDNLQSAEQHLEDARNTIDETNTKAAELEQNLKELQITAQELRKEKETMERERDEANNRASELTAEVEEAEAEGARKVAALRDQLDAKQMENKSLTDNLQSAEQHLEDARNTIDETNTKAAELEQNLKESQITAQELRKEKETMERERDEANNRASELTAEVENLTRRIDARNRGPYQAVVGARCEVFIAMEEEDTLSNDRIDAHVYPVLFNAGNRRFLATSKQSLKLNWSELVSDGDIIDLHMTYGVPAGDNRWSSKALGPLLSLSGEPKIILIEVKDSHGSAMAALPLVGRDRVVSEGLKDTFLVKSNISAPIFPVAASVDQANTRRILVNPPAVPVKDQFPWGDPSGIPEPGDHLVTIEGDLIGIMISDRVAFILDESDLNDIRFRLPLNDYAKFVSQAKALHEVTR